MLVYYCDDLVKEKDHWFHHAWQMIWPSEVTVPPSDHRPPPDQKFSSEWMHVWMLMLLPIYIYPSLFFPSPFYFTGVLWSSHFLPLHPTAWPHLHVSPVLFQPVRKRQNKVYLQCPCDPCRSVCRWTTLLHVRGIPSVSQTSKPGLASHNWTTSNMARSFKINENWLSRFNQFFSQMYMWISLDASI